jgi:hypothetical protein
VFAPMGACRCPSCGAWIRRSCSPSTMRIAERHCAAAPLRHCAWHLVQREVVCACGLRRTLRGSGRNHGAVAPWRRSSGTRRRRALR